MSDLIGELSGTFAIEPNKRASPNGNTAPSPVTIQ